MDEVEIEEDEEIAEVNPELDVCDIICEEEELLWEDDDVLVVEFVEDDGRIARYPLTPMITMITTIIAIFAPLLIALLIDLRLFFIARRRWLEDNKHCFRQL